MEAMGAKEREQWEQGNGSNRRKWMKRNANRKQKNATRKTWSMDGIVPKRARSVCNRGF